MILFDGTRYDCGSRLGFLEANIALSLDDPEIKKDVEKILQNHINKNDASDNINSTPYVVKK